MCSSGRLGDDGIEQRRGDAVSDCQRPRQALGGSKGRQSNSPDGLQRLNLAQPVIVGDERRIPDERGRRDQPVRGIAGESVAELTRALGDIVCKRLKPIFRQPPHIRQPRGRGHAEAQAPTALERRDLEEADARHEKLVTLAVLPQRLSRFGRQFFPFAIDPPYQNVGVEEDH